MSEPKTTRTRDEKRGSRTHKIAQAFLRLPPARIAANPSYRCPTGPGGMEVSATGGWYDMTDYMRRRYECGDVTDAVQSKPARATTTTTKTQPAEPDDGGK